MYRAWLALACLGLLIAPSAAADELTVAQFRFDRADSYTYVALVTYNGTDAVTVRTGIDLDQNGNVTEEEVGAFEQAMVATLSEPSTADHWVDGERPDTVDVRTVTVQSAEGLTNQTSNVIVGVALAYTFDVRNADIHDFRVARESAREGSQFRVQIAGPPGWTFTELYGFAEDPNSTAVQFSGERITRRMLVAGMPNGSYGLTMDNEAGDEMPVYHGEPAFEDGEPVLPNRTTVPGGGDEDGPDGGEITDGTGNGTGEDMAPDGENGSPGPAAMVVVVLVSILAANVKRKNNS